jgi:hypothetical protein
MKLDTKESVQQLATITKEDLTNYNYNEQEIDLIGDTSFFFSSIITDTNDSFTYYTLAFSIDTIFIALGGSVADQATFINYAKIIENRIIEAAIELEKEDM